MRNQWFVYISNNSSAQLGRLLVAPDPPLGLHHSVLLDAVQALDRAWYFDATDKRKPGISMIGRVKEGLTRGGPHDAMPKEHPIAMRRPVEPIHRLKIPISKERLLSITRNIGWPDNPFDSNGNFSWGHVYCHLMPFEMIEEILRVAGDDNLREAVTGD